MSNESRTQSELLADLRQFKDLDPRFGLQTAVADDTGQVPVEIYGPNAMRDDARYDDA